MNLMKLIFFLFKPTECIRNIYLSVNETAIICELLNPRIFVVINGRSSRLAHFLYFYCII